MTDAGHSALPDQIDNTAIDLGHRPLLDLIRRAAADPLGRLVKLSDNAHNSDPGRLALLDPEAREWFAGKYARARAVLLAASSDQYGGAK